MYQPKVMLYVALGIFILLILLSVAGSIFEKEILELLGGNRETIARASKLLFINLAFLMFACAMPFVVNAFFEKALVVVSISGEDSWVTSFLKERITSGVINIISFVLFIGSFSMGIIMSYRIIFHGE